MKRLSLSMLAYLVSTAVSVLLANVMGLLLDECNTETIFAGISLQDKGLCAVIIS